MKFPAAVIGTLSILLIASSVSVACVCNLRSVSKRKAESRSVFVGTLIKRTRETQKWRNQFLVERYWKGTKAAEITVYTTFDDCAAWFEMGEKYLVFAYFVKEGRHLETDSCMGTGELEMVSEDLRKLGKGKLVAIRTSHSRHESFTPKSIVHSFPFAR